MSEKIRRPYRPCRGFWRRDLVSLDAYNDNMKTSMIVPLVTRRRFTIIIRDSKFSLKGRRKPFNNNSNTWDHLSWVSVPIAPHMKASLHSMWRPSQKTITSHNADINRSWGVQLQWMRLHHSSFSNDSRNTEEEGSIDGKIHSTRKSVMKQCLLEMAT